jgi:hypothetical protein
VKYIQYNKDGQVVTPTDLQNKTLWCIDGAIIEDIFIDKYGKQLELVINPEKVNNPYVPDLIGKNSLADLKTQNTPFLRRKNCMESIRVMRLCLIERML